MPDEIIALSRFYADQYGMIFHNVYDPVFFVLKGHIMFRNTRKDYSIMCAGLTDKEIVGYFHSIIYDILAEDIIIVGVKSMTEVFDELDWGDKDGTK